MVQTVTHIMKKFNCILYCSCIITHKVAAEVAFPDFTRLSVSPSFSSSWLWHNMTSAQYKEKGSENTWWCSSKMRNFVWYPDFVYVSNYLAFLHFNYDKSLNFIIRTFSLFKYLKIWKKKKLFAVYLNCLWHKTDIFLIKCLRFGLRKVILKHIWLTKHVSFE